MAALGWWHKGLLNADLGREGKAINVNKYDLVTYSVIWKQSNWQKKSNDRGFLPTRQVLECARFYANACYIAYPQAYRGITDSWSLKMGQTWNNFLWLHATGERNGFSSWLKVTPVIVDRVRKDPRPSNTRLCSECSASKSLGDAKSPEHQYLCSVGFNHVSPEGLLVGLRAATLKSKVFTLLRAVLTRSGLSGNQLQPCFALGFRIRVWSQSWLGLGVVWCLGQGLALSPLYFLHSLFYQSGSSENPRKPGQNNPNACSKGLWNLFRGSLREAFPNHQLGGLFANLCPRPNHLQLCQQLCLRCSWVTVSRLLKGTHRLQTCKLWGGLKAGSMRKFPCLCFKNLIRQHVLEDVP